MSILRGRGTGEPTYPGADQWIQTEAGGNPLPVEAAAGGVQSGVGTAAGVATASATGASTAEASFSAAGAATAAATSASTAAAAGSATGAATASSTGASTAAAVGTISGTSTAAATGAEAGGAQEGVGTAAGIATATAQGQAIGGESPDTSGGGGARDLDIRDPRHPYWLRRIEEEAPLEVERAPDLQPTAEQRRAADDSLPTRPASTPGAEVVMALLGVPSSEVGGISPTSLLAGPTAQRPRRKADEDALLLLLID